MTERKQTTLMDLQAAGGINQDTNISAPSSVVGSATATVGSFSTPVGFEYLQRAAKMLAAGTIFPERFRGNIADCAIIVDMALRLNASPLFVAQNMYLVYGSPAWSSNFLIGLFNTCGKYSSIRYEFSGEEGKDDWTCVAKSVEWKTNGDLVGPPVSIALAKKEGWYDKRGSKWQTMPALMMRYRAAAFLINTVAPELSLGIMTVEEAQDVYA